MTLQQLQEICVLVGLVALLVGLWGIAWWLPLIVGGLVLMCAGGAGLSGGGSGGGPRKGK